jgi:3-oxoadipate enol-lactonase
MPKIDCGGVTLRYELTGPAGAPCVLLSNSLGTRLEMWDPQVTPFSEHFQLLRYDMRGHGESSVPPGPYTIEQLGGDLLLLLDRLLLSRVHFCGLSIGGVIGQWLAAYAPERLDSLVLCNTAAKIGVTATWNDRIAQVRANGMESIADAGMARWFTPSFMQANSATIATMRTELAHTNAEGYIASCEAIRDMDQRELVTTITTPTLIVAGAQDAVTTVQDAAKLQAAIAGSKVVTVEAAHISNIEAASSFNTAVLSFLQERASA